MICLNWVEMHVCDNQFIPVAGGSGLNTSTHLTSLLDQFWTSGKSRTSNVCFQTVVNENDDHGRMIILHCKQHGFTLINRRISNYPNCFAGSDEAASTIYSATMKDKATGHCAVIVSNGDRSFMTHLGCIEDFRGVDILYSYRPPASRLRQS